jgi:hypothetical protein
MAGSGFSPLVGELKDAGGIADDGKRTGGHGLGATEIVETHSLFRHGHL